MSSFLQAKIRTLENRLNSLITQFEANSKQFNRELSAATRILLQEQSDHLEQEIKDVESQLDSLRSGDDVHIANPPNEDNLEKNLQQGYQLLWQTTTSLKPKHLFASHDYIYLVDKNAVHFFSADDGQRLYPPLITLGDFSLAEYDIIGGGIDSSDNLLLTLLPRRWSGKASLLLLKPQQGNNQPAVEQLYQTSSAQLSAPFVDGESIYLIQSGPELVVLESGQQQSAPRIIPLPNDYDWDKDCVSLTCAAQYLYLALCDGTILALDPDHKQSLKRVRKKLDRGSFSHLATDGWWLFWGISANHKISLPSRIYVLNINTGQEEWHFDVPPDSSGKYRSIKKQPLVLKNIVCIVAGPDLYALDINTGHKLWHHEMPRSINGVGWTKKSIIVTDSQGNIAALQYGTPEFELSYHYDLKTPPTYNEWQPLNITVVNTGSTSAFNTTLRLSSDEFKGTSENHTQELKTIKPGESTSCQLNFEPKTKGSVVPLPIIIEYEYDEGIINKQELTISMPIRHSNNDHISEKERQIFQNGSFQYNFTVLRTLLIVTLTDRELTRLCHNHFRPLYDTFRRNTKHTEKIKNLVEHVMQHQQVDHLLGIIQNYDSISYQNYIQEIKLDMSSAASSQTLAEFDQTLSYKLEEQTWYAPEFPDTEEVIKTALGKIEDDIDVVIITATEVELKAVLHVVTPLPRRKQILLVYDGPETYYFGKFGAHQAVITKCRMGAIGEGSVILATEQAQRLWRPKAIIMVGLAFGKNPEKQNLGDVLVASQIISYEQQRVGAEIIHRGDISPSNTTLLNRFENIQNWKFIRPDGQRCAIYIGPILSGEKLIDDPQFKAALLNRFPQAIGGEMEGAGLVAASGRVGTAWILIKSICDWGDGQKHKKHQPLAAATAVSLVHHVLKQKTVLKAIKKPD